MKSKFKMYISIKDPNNRSYVLTILHFIAKNMKQFLEMGWILPIHLKTSFSKITTSVPRHLT